MQHRQHINLVVIDILEDMKKITKDSDVADILEDKKVSDIGLSDTFCWIIGYRAIPVVRSDLLDRSNFYHSRLFRTESCSNQSGQFCDLSTMSESYAVEDAYIASIYMKQKFPSVLLRALGDTEKSPDVKIPHPRSWSIEFSLEVDLALDVIARAFHNQGLLATLIL